jgi:hypothetical protein
MVLPLVSKLMVVTTGSPVVAAPFTAAATSSLEDMVSIHSTSTPPSAKALACSAKAAMASASVSEPMGSNRSPVGPIEPATITSRPTWSFMALSATLRPISAARLLISCTRSWAWCSFSRFRVPPKLLVRKRSAPESTKLWCSASIRSGCSKFQSSGESPVISPMPNRFVPVAPSAIRKGRSLRSFKKRFAIAGPAYLILPKAQVRRFAPAGQGTN